MIKPRGFKLPLVRVVRVKSGIEARFHIRCKQQVSRRIPGVAEEYIGRWHRETPVKVVDAGIQYLRARGIQEPEPNRDRIFVAVPAPQAVITLRIAERWCGSGACNVSHPVSDSYGILSKYSPCEQQRRRDQKI